MLGNARTHCTYIYIYAITIDIKFAFMRKAEHETM